MEFDNIKLLNCDCMEYMKSLPDKYFDLCITDPPYGLGLDMVTKVDGNARNNRKNRSVVSHAEKDWNNEIPPPEYFSELHRISKHQIIWGCNYYAQYIPAVGRIVHDKIMGTENTAFNWSHADIASCSLQRRITMFRYQWGGNKQNGTINWDNTGNDARIHPTQKPIALYKWLLKNYATPDMKIFDSHLGSGSSAIAAWEFKCAEFIGTEIDLEYYDAAVASFQNHVRQMKLF